MSDAISSGPVAPALSESQPNFCFKTIVFNKPKQQQHIKQYLHAYKMYFIRHPSFFLYPFIMEVGLDVVSEISTDNG